MVEVLISVWLKDRAGCHLRSNGTELNNEMQGSQGTPVMTGTE